MNDCHDTSYILLFVCVNRNIKHDTTVQPHDNQTIKQSQWSYNKLV